MIALIPARGGSKGVPQKNIKTLHEYPLIAYSIIATLKCRKINRVIVSTDSPVIAKIAELYGAEVPFIRPSAYAQDTSTDYDVVNHFFEKIDTEEVAYMRPTTPLRDPKKLSDFIDFFYENKNKMTGMRSMHEISEPPYKVYKIENGFCKGFFKDYKGVKDYANLPRQIFPKAYQPNGYLDIIKKETILKGDTAFGMGIMPVITEYVTEIDMEHEFNFLDYQLLNEKNVLLELLKENFSD